MLLGGLALVFSRLIDNGVIVLENIFRHMEMGKSPQVAADEGGTEVAMAVLAATFTTAIVFFPVTTFSGVSKYIFTPLALGVVFSIFASYFIAMTVVPLYCAKFIKPHDEEGRHGRNEAQSSSLASTAEFNAKFQAMLDWYEALARKTMQPARRDHRGHLCRHGRPAGSHVPLSGPGLFPAHRPGPVHHRRAHAQRDAPRGQQRLYRQG